MCLLNNGMKFNRLSLGLGLWCFNAIFNNISIISWRSVFIARGNQCIRRKPLTCRKSLTNFYDICCIRYTSTWVGFKLTTLVVIGTDCIGSCKSNYHTITTTAAPWNLIQLLLSNNQQKRVHLYSMFIFFV
jgi:hypothetical protein